MNNSSFLTSDLNLAAYLLATGHRLLGLEGPAGRRSFVFARVPQDAVAAYFADAHVSARQLLNALRDLKALLSQWGGRP
jgi:hypothetical protein